jgi:hypothetical protein
VSRTPRGLNRDAGNGRRSGARGLGRRDHRVAGHRRRGRSDRGWNGRARRRRRDRGLLRGPRALGLSRRFAPVLVAAGARPAPVSPAAVLCGGSRRRGLTGYFVLLSSRLWRGGRLLFPGRGLLAGAFLLLPGFVAFVAFLAVASLTSTRPACVFLTRAWRARGRLRGVTRLRGHRGVRGRTRARMIAPGTIPAGTGEWGRQERERAAHDGHRYRRQRTQANR